MWAMSFQLDSRRLTSAKGSIYSVARVVSSSASDYPYTVSIEGSSARSDLAFY